MAQQRRNTQRMATQRQNTYIEGNTVRKQERRQTPDRRQQTRPTLVPQPKPRKVTNITTWVVMGLALLVAGVILTWYITLQSEITATKKNISNMESQLAELKQENDEAYSRANSKLDLEEIKRIAIQEYGMQYADQGQIVTYSDEGGNDYVRQNAEIPQTASK